MGLNSYLSALQSCENTSSLRMKNIIVLMFIIYEQQYDKTKGPLLQH